MHPILFSIGSLTIRANTVFFLLGCLVGVWVGRQEAERVGFNRKEVLPFFVGFLPFVYAAGMLNAWLFNIGSISRDPGWQTLLYGGWISYGGILGALLFCLLYPRTHKDDSIKRLEIVALVLPLFEGIYRIGCLLNGCCYGSETTGFGGMYLPDTFGQWAVRYPTQIMYIALGFGLFFILWQMRTRKRFKGEITVLYLILYGLGRLAIDGLRANLIDLGWINLHQAVDIGLMIIGLAVWCVLFLKRKIKPQ